MELRKLITQISYDKDDLHFNRDKETFQLSNDKGKTWEEIPTHYEYIYL